ncbi:glycosyltransferase family 39 protein [Streptomyces diastatochromogenes]|nr:glycosyltransferase family 39 protein [Streptomyces diastatochromogenes]
MAFGLVGLSGIAVNTAALWFFHSTVGLHQLLGATLATQVSSLWNWALLETLVYRGGQGGSRRAALARGAAFLALNNLLLLGRLPLLELFVLAGVGLLTANVLSLVVLFVVRFLFSDLLIYRRRHEEGARRDPVRVLVAPGAPSPAPRPLPAAASATAHPKRPRYLTYRYDIAGTVTIGSQIRLPELEFFRAQWVPPGACDITVRVGDVGRRLPRHRAVMTEIPGLGAPRPTTVQYEEQLGRLGANFRVDIGDPIDVLVSPLLARSPHVVYTNVLEALLRFVLVSRDRMLLHSACVELGGTGVMLSALTDTGKTSTVLRLLSEHDGRFLSDDMTVVDAGGNALCFPKPLTISAHTLHAVRSDDLTPHEWHRLQRQSRLHSKEGRSFAFTLARHNLPIMGINAVTQILVPPPKYAVDRLVDCRLSSAVKVTELFVIERGEPRLGDLGHEETVDRLLVNTEDAYGFPPFRYFAPAITVDGLDHAQLRGREREVLSGFLSGVRTRVLASDRFGWADEIPRLLAADRPAVNGHPVPRPTDTRGRTGRRRRRRRTAPARARRAPAPPPRRPGRLRRLPPGGPRREDAMSRPRTPERTRRPPRHGSRLHKPPGTAGATGARPVGRPRRRPTAAWVLRGALPLTAVLALAAFLRFWQLTSIGLNSDEAVYTGTAASLAGDPTMQTVFPVFRAHPVLFASVLSLFLRGGADEFTARAVAAVIGVLTVAVTYLLARSLYGRAAGLAAALLLAVMPYHVVVTRQVLLDGLMTLCATVALYCVVRYVRADRDGLSWLLGAAGALGAATLSKETALVLVCGLYVFFVLSRSARMRWRHAVLATGVLALVFAAFPLAIWLAGRGSTGQNYLQWQLFRRANHPMGFYATTVPQVLGWAVLAAAVTGLVWLRRRNGWREGLLLCWIAAPVLFFTLWPVKGFPICCRSRRRSPCSPAAPWAPSPGCGCAPAAADPGPAAVRRLRRPRHARRRAVPRPPVRRPDHRRSEGLVPGRFRRPAGRPRGGPVVRAHVPGGHGCSPPDPRSPTCSSSTGQTGLGAVGERQPALPQPLVHPVPNPDRSLRDGEFQYLVWDSYTAHRAPSTARRSEAGRQVPRRDRLHLRRAGPRVRHRPDARPVIVIYQVRAS